MTPPSVQDVDRPWFCKCGRLKQATNHWTVVLKNGDVIEFMSWAKAIRRRLLGAPNVVLLCGQDCGHKELNEFYDTLLAKRVFPPSVTTTAQQEPETVNAGDVVEKESK